MAVLNSTILERAWLSGTNDYQQRIPNPSISSYAEHVAAIFEPMNNDLFNQFTGMLNGLIGTTVESDLFEAPVELEIERLLRVARLDVRDRVNNDRLCTEKPSDADCICHANMVI